MAQIINNENIPIPKLLSQTLQRQGTLFKEVNASTVGHYAGVNTLLTGNYMYSQGLRAKPLMPTIFEYLRRHTGEKATKCWFVGNGIGNSIPLLDYSDMTIMDPSMGRIS